MSKEIRKAVAYLRTSSQATSARTRTATSASSPHRSYAKAAGYEIVDTFYDAAVSGADR